MKLTLRQCLALRGAINLALTGRAQIVRQNNENTLSPPIPFSIDADTMFALAKNDGALAVPLQAYDKTRSTTILSAQQKAGGSIKVGSVEETLLSQELEALLDSEHDVKLNTIELAKLKLDINGGLAAALPALLPILKTGG